MNQQHITKIKDTVNEIGLIGALNIFGGDKSIIRKAYIDNPESYLDKTVLIEGEVLDVCPMMRCWMEIKSDDGEGMIKVKVKDGDMVSPVLLYISSKIYSLLIVKMNYFSLIHKLKYFTEFSGKNNCLSNLLLIIFVN